MKKLFLYFALAITAGCASQQVADEMIAPDFPQNKSTEISLSVYDKDGRITKQLHDENSYSDKNSASKVLEALTFTKDHIAPEVQCSIKYDVKPESWIVISIPDDVRQGSIKRNTENVRDAKSTTSNVENTSNKKDNKEFYSTTGYYNYAENQIEKRLLSIGFNVVDRSKYLAKIKEYTEKEKSGISDVVNLVSSGNTRGDFEDVSDVLRLAATDFDVKSDYILQINKFSFGKEPKTLHIKKFPKIKRHLNTYPQMASQIPDVYNYPEYNVTFDAKLIEVQTGKIMWLGTHRVNTGRVLSSVEMDMEININAREYISNKQEIIDFYAFQNTPEQRAKRRNTIIAPPPLEREISFDFSVSPDFEKVGKQGEANPLLKGFREEMIKLVTKELINTINMDYCKQRAQL